MAYRLGVDLGTTFTAAAVQSGSGSPEVVGLGNRASQVPSVMFLSEDGSFLCGEAAERRAATQPERVVREFKRRIGDTVPVLVDGRPFSPQTLTATLLEWVVGVVTQRQGGAPELVVLTRPANWGTYKQELFDEVAALADLPRVVMMTEPEAAATQYAARAALPAGGRVAVYDLGGGTFDVCVLEKQAAGFTVLGTPDGVEHLGGVDFDEAVFRAVLERVPEAVGALDLEDPLALSGLARLRRDCVDAKEALSVDVEAVIPVILPGITTSVRLTRSELEQLITPALSDTLAATRRALRSAGLDATDLDAVVLVGGSSRIPMVSHLLHSELGVRTAMDTHPKHDVVLGAARYGGWVTPMARTVEPTEEPAATQPIAPARRAGGRTDGDRRRMTIVSAAAMGSLVAVGAVVWGATALTGDGRRTDASTQPSRSSSASTGPETNSPPTTPRRRDLVVPIRGSDGDQDLYVVDTTSGARTRIRLAGDQDLPSLSPGEAVLQFRTTRAGGASVPQTLVSGSRPADLFTAGPAPGVTDCGPLVWRSARGSAAILCSVPVSAPPAPTPSSSPTPTPSTESSATSAPTPTQGPSPTPRATPTTRTPPSPGPSATVTPSPTPRATPTPTSAPTRGPSPTAPPGLTPTGDELGGAPDAGLLEAVPVGLPPAVSRPAAAAPTRPEPARRPAVFSVVIRDGVVDGRRMREVKPLADPRMSGLISTPDGGLAVSYGSRSSAGIWWLPPEARRAQRLTEGRDTEPAASAASGNIVFVRGGDLFLHVAKGESNQCRGRDRVCPLTRGPARDSAPTWSWDGARVAFLRSDRQGTSTELRVMELARPFRSTLLVPGSVGVAGGPLWAPR